MLLCFNGVHRWKRSLTVFLVGPGSSPSLLPHQPNVQDGRIGLDGASNASEDLGVGQTYSQVPSYALPGRGSEMADEVLAGLIWRTW